MNIVLVTGGWVRIPPQEGGGVEVYLFNLAEQITKMGWDVFLIDGKYTKDDHDMEIINGVKVIRLESFKINWFSHDLNFLLSQIIWAQKIKSWLKDKHFDVIYVCVPILGLALSVFSKRIKKRLIYSSHSLRRDKPSYGFIDRIAIFLENRIVKKAKLTIIANEIIAEKIIKQAKVSTSRVKVVTIGIDTEQYHPDNLIGNIKEKYKLGDDNIVLFVGRVCADKGVEYLVKAADIVVNRYGKDNVRFLVVGPSEQFNMRKNTIGNYWQKVNQLVDDYMLQNKVIFTGTVQLDDKIKLYTACDILVVPSIVDLDPRVPIEAMASGKPVIGTNVGTIPRRITDGQNGFIVEPADEKQLADKINYLLDNPEERKKMGMYARKTVEENYSADKMAARMIEVFEDASS